MKSYKWGNSFSLKVREQLDAPLNNRFFLFYLFFPLFYFLSWVVSFVAKRRRLHCQKLGNTVPSSLSQSKIKIVCVGNVIMGGTGKSPVVQKIAQEFLEKGCFVVIASRGISQEKGPVYHDVSRLSDENREHFYLLSWKGFSGKFLILQNKNRMESFKFFENYLKENRIENEALFLLDDGLQHFACPRHLDLCLWQTRILKNSPPYPFPVGPFREGFGKTALGELLDMFPYRIWSRTSFSDLDNYIQEIRDCLDKFHISSSDKDIAVTYSLKCLTVSQKNGQFIYEVLSEETAKSICQIGLMTGIANPSRFSQDMRLLFKNLTQTSELFLEDHAQIEKHWNKIRCFLEKENTLVFTGKDFFRWFSFQPFQDSIAKKKVMICYIELETYDMQKNSVSLLEKIKNEVPI